MRVRFTRPALADLRALTEYIADRLPQGAQSVRQRIKSSLERLTDNPALGRQTEDPTIRRLTTAPYPYLIFYEATATDIIVHAVRHGARDPASMPDAP